MSIGCLRRPKKLASSSNGFCLWYEGRFQAQIILEYPSPQLLTVFVLYKSCFYKLRGLINLSSTKSQMTVAQSSHPPNTGYNMHEPLTSVSLSYQSKHASLLNELVRRIILLSTHFVTTSELVDNVFCVFPASSSSHGGERRRAVDPHFIIFSTEDTNQPCCPAKQHVAAYLSAHPHHG